MSSRNTRSVQAVNAAPQVNASASAVSVARLAASLARFLGAAAFKSFRQHTAALDVGRTLMPASTLATLPIAQRELNLSGSALHLSEVDTLKLGALVDIASKPYFVEPGAIEQRINALKAATTAS